MLHLLTLFTLLFLSCTSARALAIKGQSAQHPGNKGAICTTPSPLLNSLLPPLVQLLGQLRVDTHPLLRHSAHSIPLLCTTAVASFTFSY